MDPFIHKSQINDHKIHILINYQHPSDLFNFLLHLII